MTTLSEEGRAIALEELREDEQTREQSVATMRDWVERSACILRCRTGKYSPTTCCGGCDLRGCLPHTRATLAICCESVTPPFPRADDNFLLRFLRSKKFSVPLAQEAVTRYLLLRQSIGFRRLDCENPVMADLIDKGCVCDWPQGCAQVDRQSVLHAGYKSVLLRLDIGPYSAE